MLKRFLAGFLLVSTAFLCGCQTTLTASDTTGETAEVIKPVVPISTIIETATFQYPSVNEDFYYEVYDTYIAITQYVGGAKECVKVPDAIDDKPVYVIAEYAFKKAEIQKIDISKNIYSIGEEAFQSCTALQSVRFVDVVNVIEDSTVGTGVVKIGKNAFNNCSTLSALELPDGVLTLSEGAFYGCTNLREIHLPDTVTGLGNSLFYDCASLEQIKIPPLVTYIPVAFCSGCTSLKDVYIDATVTEIASSAFNSVPNAAVFHSTATSTAAEYAAAYFFGFEVIETPETSEVPDADSTVSSEK